MDYWLFAFRLAKEIGTWDVDGMLENMTWRQLLLWIEYDRIDPFGEERADLRVAQLTSLTANINCDFKKRPHGFTELDFMPFTRARISESHGDSPPTALATEDAWDAFAGGMVAVARSSVGE